MKTTFTSILLICFSFSFFAQEDIITIRSNKLDSLIWEKINDHRERMGKNRIELFEDSLMRAFGRRLTEINHKQKNSEHSDSVGFVANGECLFTIESKKNGSKEPEDEIKAALNGDFEYFAEKAVYNWINSPSHNRILLSPSVSASTVTTVLTIELSPSKSYFRSKLNASYHCLYEGIQTSSRYDISKLIISNKKKKKKK
jgi:hypothetical protein